MVFKPKDGLYSKDSRQDQVVVDKMRSSPTTLEDLWDLMAPLELNARVPGPIRQQFDTARNAFVYSWFDCDMATLAEHHAYGTIETALRHLITTVGMDAASLRGLHNLWTMAVKLKLVSAEDYEVPSPFDASQKLSQIEFVRMLRNNLSHGKTHLLPDGSLAMMRLCIDIINRKQIAALMPSRRYRTR